MNSMKPLFMRTGNITNNSISSLLKSVLPSVTTAFAHELIRSQKLDAKTHPMDPFLLVAILGSQP